MWLIHKAELEPIVRIGENVAIAEGPTEDRWTYGRVIFLEPVQPIIKNVGPLSAATATSYPAVGTKANLDEIKLGSGEFGQWRIFPIDDFYIQLNQPSAVGRFLTKSGPTYASKLSALKSQMVEVFTWEDSVPSVTPINPLFIDQTLARLMIVGFRYVIDELPTKPSEYTVIPVAGLATRKS